MFYMDADLDIFVTPESVDVQEAMNKFEAASNTVSLISELTSPVVSGITRTESMDSQISWESFLPDAVYRNELNDTCDNEIDIDLEMEKALEKNVFFLAFNRGVENFDDTCLTTNFATKKLDLSLFKYNPVNCTNLYSDEENYRFDSTNTNKAAVLFEISTNKSFVSSSEPTSQRVTNTSEKTSNQSICERVTSANGESYI
uniref:Uncharacterized protein n=1 Tax=Heterorhabditis bacteriophora TaxID=37862 RepID=A0A1I7X240_HETBA